MEYSMQDGIFALLAALPLMLAVPGITRAAGPVIPQGRVADTLSAVLAPKTAPAVSSSESVGIPQIGAVVNGASFTPDVAPGALITLFISNASSLLTAGADSAPLPISLGGATVKINGNPLPILFSSSGQINAQLPYEIPVGNTSVTVTVGTGTATSSAFPFTVVSAAPGIFVFGTNRAIAQNPDTTLNNIGNPVAAGAYTVVYLTGGGALDHPVITGSATPVSPLFQVTGKTSATIGGQNAPVLFLGMTSGFVGLYQANLQIPSNLPPGDHPIIITVNNNASNAPLITTK